MPTDHRDFSFRADDGKEIVCTEWLSEDGSKPRAILHIVHGMAEHRKRYTHFARYLVNAGYTVYAEDHRGHGDTAGSIETVGFFAEKDGWQTVVTDIHHLSELAQAAHPGIPIILLGHSMGSILARDYISQYGGELSGAILSGVAADPGPIAVVGKWIAQRQISSKGAKTQSFQLDKMTFGNYNNTFKPNATKFDWLSRDEREVAAYIADPYCGAVFTAGFFLDLIEGTRKIFRNSTVDKTPKNLPLLFLSGARDPVGRFGKGVEQAIQLYKNAGLTDIEYKIYPDARHEVLHELNKAEVYEDVRLWLDKRANG